MRVVGIGIVAVLAVGVIYVWNTWQNPGEAEPSAEPSSQAQNSTMADTEPAAEILSAETNKTNPSNIAENSQNPDSEVLDLSVNTEALPALMDTEALPVEASTANANPNVVDIPAGGYPVEDSMKYYVPKHERTPGNLGGPPPPPFMVPENAQGERSIEALLPPAPDAPAQ